MRPGRCLAPCSSAKTNLTRTTSPRLKLVIRGVPWVVPKVRQHRISAFVEGDQIGRRQLVGQIVLQARLDGLPHVVPNGLITLRRRNVNAAPCFAWNINAEPRSTLLGSRHRNRPEPHWHKYVNVSMCLMPTTSNCKERWGAWNSSTPTSSLVVSLRSTWRAPPWRLNALCWRGGESWRDRE